MHNHYSIFRPGSGIRHSVPGRTSSIISNTSSSSFNDDYSDDDYDDEDDEDNIDGKCSHTKIFMPNYCSIYLEKAIHILTASESQRPLGMSHAVAKTSSTKRAAPDDKLKKRSSQISKELSDMVIYVQVSVFKRKKLL